MKFILWVSVVLCCAACVGAVVSLVLVQLYIFSLCAIAVLLSAENALFAQIVERGRRQ